MGFLANIQQFNLLTFFTTNGCLGRSGVLQRIATRFLHIFLQRMAVQRDNQRYCIGMDYLNAIFVIDVLFPERGKVYLNGIKIVAPFVRIVGSDAVTCNRTSKHDDAITLGIQR